jgi:hypothetical protein
MDQMLLAVAEGGTGKTRPLRPSSLASSCFELLQQFEKEATVMTPIIVSDERDEVTTLPEMPVEPVGRTGGRNTRRKGASKAYRDAITIERETEDEREARRAKKVSKRQRKETTGKEVDGLLTELGMTATA